MRLASLLAAPLLFSADVFCFHAPAAGALCTGLWWALMLLMLYPSSGGKALDSGVALAVGWVAAVVLKLLGAPPGGFVAAGSLLLFAFTVRRGVMRFREVPPLFLVSTVWPGVIDYLNMIHTCALFMTGAWLCVLPHKPVAEWLLAALLLAFYVLQYYRVYTRSTLFLGARKENMIRQGQRGSGYRMPIQYVDSESRSAVLFNEVVKVMETKKPYLRESFSENELSRMVHTNRLYLSKAINFHSGRNFNQLVNYYRVKYAVELIKKDSGLKMTEVAQMSGFHTVVSFNMAFKLNEHLTPSEFARSLKKLT